MEDQPADSGDLTTGSVDKPARTRRWPWRRANKVATPEVPPDEDSSAAEADEPAEESATKVPTGKSRRTPKPVVEELEAESEASEPEPAQETESDPELTDPEPPPLLMPYRPAGKRLLIAATAASVLFVAAGAFAGATLQPYLADRAAVETKLDIARTATEAITTLWTYTPDDMAALPDRSSRFLTGDFATEYRRYIDAIVAANAQAQVSNTTEVTGAAVESLSADEASALVYTNSVSTSPVSKNIPSLQYRSYRLTMERDNADWRITSMVPVTNLDLTPQL